MIRVPSYTQFRPASEAASRAKRANRRDGGRAERLLRQAVWRLGLRFRKHPAGLPGRPDLLFSRANVCVFVDGDFWHGRNWPQLHTRLLQRANADYWVPKIARNMERDREQTRILQELGWSVLRVWETDALADPGTAAFRVREEVENKRAVNGTLTRLTQKRAIGPRGFRGLAADRETNRAAALPSET